MYVIEVPDGRQGRGGSLVRNVLGLEVRPPNRATYLNDDEIDYYDSLRPAPRCPPGRG